MKPLLYCAIFLIAIASPRFLTKEAHADTLQWLAQCAPYRSQVEAILSEENLSLDYYFLLVAESKCTLNAKSSEGAMGFWQMVKSTAQHYGCTDPHDLESATRAAAAYIKHLQNSFKTFDDVIAAYNMGGHNLKKNGRSPSAQKLVHAVKYLKKLDAKHPNGNAPNP